MSLQTYALTFQFSRSVVWYNDQQVPELLEVVVIPLANPSFPDEGTYVGGLQTQSVLLTDATNSVSFNLVPSYAAGLSEPVLYRAEWRSGGVTGRTFTQEFAMPSQNATFDQLATLSDYVTGTDYIQQTQIGVAGGIAALNGSGEVVDATNTPVAAQSDIDAVNAAIAVEVTNRTNAITALNNTLSTSLSEDINSLGTTTATNLANAVATINATAVSDYDSLNNLITAEATTRASANTTFTSEITTINSTLTTLSTSVSHKANLDTSGQFSGYLTESQVPPYLFLNAYAVSGEGGMLALSNSGSNGSLPPIHYGDIAVWANGAVWMLVGNINSPVLYPDPSQIGNWIDLTSVYAVQGKVGNVTLTPQDLGAVGINGSYGAVTQAQVTGLSSTLATYTPLSSFNTLNTTVTGILNNTNIVYLDTSGPSSGYINHAKLDASVAYVNNLSEVTLKDGTVIASGTSSVLSVNSDTGPNVVLTAADVGAIAVGASINISQVTGLSSELATFITTSDSRLSNARTPTAHAASHELGGSDALLLDWTQVADTTGTTDNIPTLLALYAPLTTTDTQAAQITALQNEVTFLLGGGTPSSSPIKATWFDGVSTFTGVTSPAAFQTTYGVQQKSPFGFDPVAQAYYYNPAGAAANQWVYPYITPGGHLKFTQWNESNPADPTYATTTQLATVNATIATLATNASLAALQTQVNASATQAEVNTINTTINGLATTAALNSIATSVANCATQAQLNTTNATVATLATASSVASLSSTVSTLATQSSVNALSSAVTANTNSIALKADLTGPSSTVPLNEMPQNIPISYVSGLSAAISGLCPLVSSLVPLSNIPALPISQITNLSTSLAALCPLVGGLIPSQYLPSLAITNVFTEPNEAGMLALSGATAGDICVITGTSAAGTYILANTPPSVFSNWVLLPNVQDVTSVNGQIGAVNLTAASVGAMATGQAIPISQITGLASQLSTLATTTALNTAVSGLVSLAQVQGTLTASTEIKQLVNYVANTAIPSLAGQQSIDGVLTPLNSIVLATAQPSSVNNGLWVVQSGAWTRTTDYATGAYFVRGSLAFIQSGTQFSNTIWQETANSGVVDTSPSNWSKIMTAGGPIAYAAGNGVALNAQTFSANVVSGGGLSVSPSGLSIDTSVTSRHVAGYVPSNGSTVVTFSHNLNTQDVVVQVREVSSGNKVLVCDTVTGPNTITLEFAAPPSSNQYRVTVMG